MLQTKRFAIAVLMGLVAAASPSRAANQMDQLHALIDQLHQAESDWWNEIHSPNFNNDTANRLEAQGDAIRKRIIEFVRTMKPQPPVPAGFNEAFGKASYQFKSVKAQNDYFAAADSFAEASDLAPWLPDPYFNMGLATEKQHDYADAVRWYRLYLLAAPNAPDVAQVEQRIGGLTYAGQHKDEELASAFLDSLRDQYWGVYRVWACINCTPADYFDRHSLTSNPAIDNQFTITVERDSLVVTDTSSGTVWFRGKPRCISYGICPVDVWDWSDARSGRAIGGLINGKATAMCGGRVYNQVLLTLDALNTRAPGRHTYWEFDKKSNWCN